MSSRWSFVSLNEKKPKTWLIMSYIQGCLTMILSVAILILIQFLDRLDLLRLFLFYSQSLSQLVIMPLLMITIMFRKKTWILAFGVFGLIFGIGYFVTLSVIELSNFLQLYSGQVGLQPAHPNGWYVVLDIVLISSFLQSLISILACTSAFKFRGSMPDLITDGVIIQKIDKDEEDNSMDYEASRKIFSSKEIRAQAKTYNFNDQDDGIMMASSQLNENLIRSYE